MSTARLPAVGSVLGGRYRLTQPIGAGGMGMIWEADHLTLGSTVALKFLHRVGPPEGESAQRFVREAHLSAAIKHRNVVDILDFGVPDDGHPPYMVMERLEGGSLADLLLRVGPLPIAEAARLVSLLLRGLSAVHDAGVVHRDLKPENVWLVEDEDGSFPKLLDFGISRPFGRSDMTATGMLLGTPEYMSPEQAAGKSDIDARADLYSVGVILYELLTGRLPFERASTIELLDAVLRAPPIPLRELRPDVPDALVEIVERALSKSRDARFANTREMRSALAAADLGVRLTMESGLIRLSELPPPALDMFEHVVSEAAGPPPAERAAPTAADTAPAPVPAVVPASKPPAPAEPVGRDRGDSVSKFVLAARRDEAPKRRGTRVLVLLALLAAVAGVAYWAYSGRV